ncbi:putative dynein heavy chain [Trypanosoma conorhini]|uniref:Putative dynein heavy chain n=1 Tax=Trypanosoma conorhini TaxID=83891 RepID=A0A422NM93_9TRYP|nr:putative dynein heavy chain [Trypanosoma conorhini]RNF06524.1 putative dynein heavy chain [Trypanosoma conorhini]
MEQQVVAVHYQRMEEWLGDRKAVLGKRHKKEFARLMELAPRLVQWVRYDIPAQHKQQKRLSAALDDAHRAIEDAAKARQNIEEREKRFVQEYGLEEARGAAEEELESAVEGMVAASTILLNEALREFGRSAHLEAFRAAYARVAQMHSMGMHSSDVFAVHFPWLERVYQQKSCKPPAEPQSGEQQRRQQEVEKEVEATAGPHNIDWGEFDPAEPIDVDAAVEIKWDGETLSIAAEGATGADHSGGGDGGAAEEGCEENVADNVEGVTFVDVSISTHRHNILTELQALLCFASERASMDDDSLVDDGVAVDSLVKRLTTSTEASFVRLKTSPTLRHSFMEELRRFRRGLAAADLRKHNSQARVQQLEEELERLGPQLEALISDARKCRDECLAELMKMFPGRTVAIVGDINKYL